MPPLMKCGHAANSFHVLKDGTTVPSCVICWGIHSGADTIDDTPPTLEGRMARCYEGCSMVPSSTALAFFEYIAESETDRYYCGCRGWD